MKLSCCLGESKRDNRPPFSWVSRFIFALPTTFPIARVRLDILTYTGDQATPSQNTFECHSDGPLLGTTATSGEIFVPSTCNGLPV